MKKLVSERAPWMARRTTRIGSIAAAAITASFVALTLAFSAPPGQPQTSAPSPTFPPPLPTFPPPLPTFPPPLPTFPPPGGSGSAGCATWSGSAGSSGSGSC